MSTRRDGTGALISRTLHRRAARFAERLWAVILTMSLVLSSGVGVLAYRGSEDDADKKTGEEEMTDDHRVIDPRNPDVTYSSILYDRSNGLPTSESNDVLITKEGSVWIGGYSGLIRYDGSTFTRIEGNSQIASVVSLHEDSRGRIWVGTNDSGAAVMIDWQWHTFNKKDGLESLTVKDIAEDSKGNVYLATTAGLYYVDKDLVLHTVESPKLKGKYIRSIKTGLDDVIYGVILDKNDGVFTVRDGELTGFYEVDELGMEGVRAVLPDPNANGLVYLGTDGSELFYGALKDDRFKSMERIYTHDLRNVNSIEKVGDLIWICCENGFGYLSGYTFTPVTNTPMTESVEKVTSDYLGNLWMASSKQGIMKMVPNQFSDVSGETGLGNYVVNTTCLYGDELFIGTKNDGIKVIKDGSVVSTVPVNWVAEQGIMRICDNNLISMLDKCKIRCIIQDDQGYLWICTFDDTYGLLKYKNGKLTKYTSRDGLPSERIRSIVQLDKEKFAICCTGGLAIMEKGIITKVYDESYGITNTEILTCSPFVNGDIVIGTDGGGLYRINGESVMHLGTDDGLSSDVVLRVKKDKTRPIMWIVSSNSLGYMTDDYKVTVLDEFPYSNNFDVYENSRNEMWVVSSNGIYVSEVEDLLNGDEISTIYYGTDNGLQHIATSNSYSCLTDEGDLYIAGTTGVSMINIEKEYENVNDLKLSIPYILADSQILLPDDNGNFHVPMNTNKITLEISVYNYSLLNPNITYELEGNDRHPVTLKRSEIVPIDYTNLKGGTYEFRVRIDDPRGLSNREEVITIIKEKTFFEQPWARLLILVFILALILVAVKVYIEYRTRKFIKKANEQKELIREMVEAFAKMIDMKDRYTNGHSTRVAQYTALLSKELGFDEDTTEKYYNIALLHDIGKIGIPPEVLNKPGKLNDEEYEIIKSHSPLGYDALKDISIMPELAIGAGAHHERPDGKGYPKGLKGDEIPRVAQIIAVADTFDAMYSDRPYRKHMDFEKVCSIMREGAGTQLAPDVVDAFMRLVEKGEIHGHLDTPEDES